MEEIGHVFLGHKPNRLAVIVRNATVRGGAAARKTLAREYNHADEEAAYAVGAAALVPYASLRRLVFAGRDSQDIARRFRVSRQLIEYRIKVTHLWANYRSLRNREPEPPDGL
jgi:hypothetical protein